MSGCPMSTVRVDRIKDLQAVLRSKSALESAEVSTEYYIEPSAAAETNIQEFFQGIVTMINGDEHRQRRRLLNSLVRPEELIRFREHVILPSVDRWLGRAVKKNAEGLYTCDLADVVERIFLEFAAKIIGLQGVESEEGMARLRSCVLPIFGGMSSSHFENRDAVVEAGVAAKKVFVEEYYKPSLAYVQEQMKRVAAGELADEDVPLNLLKMIVTGADPGYADEGIAIREAILFFVATTGTSTQAVLSTIEDLSHWFVKHPEDAALVEDTEFISNALQESLRLKAPYVSFVTRVAADDVDVPGCPIKSGDAIQGWIAQAGRDPEVFGSDANEFNPKREVPDGYNRYGLAFATGAHQCLGLRAVLGNDGRSGSHLRMIQHFFKLGVRRDLTQVPRILEMRASEQELEIPTYITFPVVFTNWEKNA